MSAPRFNRCLTTALATTMLAGTALWSPSLVSASIVETPATLHTLLPHAGPSAISNSLDINAGVDGINLSKDLYGLFYEDINYAADGGLYAEMVRNRSFEFNAADNGGWRPDTGAFVGVTAWKVVDGPAAGEPEVGVTSNDSMLNKNNRSYLNINASGPGDGVRNAGFNTGFSIDAGKSYDFSVWARSTVAQDMSVDISNDTGATVAAGIMAVDGSDTWKKYAFTLTATQTTHNGSLGVVTGAAGLVKLDMVSLMPEDTWVGPVNGRSTLRRDLGEKLAALNPSFLRFPGGCVTNVGTFSGYEESNFTDRKRTYQWKETIGPVEERPTNWNIWGYNQSYGIGYLEYFKLAEDLGATPLPVLSVGANGCGGAGIDEMLSTDPRFQRWVSDTVDLIEFANGDASTTWGAKRIALGHTEPFHLRYIGLGNEENTHTFEENFPAFRDAIKSRFPDVQVISNSGPLSSGARFDELWEYNRDQKVDLVDEHYYSDPSWFLSNTHRYDSYDRNGPKVFLGEYASKGNSLYNSLAEAAYMTSLERNSDVVKLASYAPLFANEDYIQWTPDMIWFNNHQSWTTPNYEVQKLFMNNEGDVVVPSILTDPSVEPRPLTGGVFLSTWKTAASYDNVKVTGNDDGRVLFQDFFDNESKWTPQGGAWSVQDGRYAQKATDVDDARSIVADTYQKDWSNYTLEMDAKKTAGSEGFLVGFAAGAPDNFFWWNLGGWDNTRSVLEKASNSGPNEVKALENQSIETNKDYKIKIMVKDRHIDLYLDGKLQMSYDDPAAEQVNQIVTRDKTSGDLIVKVVNTDTAPRSTSVRINDAQLTGAGQATEISGDPGSSNTKDNPNVVKPVVRPLEGITNNFTYTFPASSVTFLRLATKNDTPPTVKTIDPVAVTTSAGVAPVLPETVRATMSDGSTKDVTATWSAVDPAAYATPGARFEVAGSVEGSTVAAKAVVTVTDTTAPIVSISTDPTEPNGADGWFTSLVTVTASATDDSDLQPTLQMSNDGGTGWVDYQPTTVTEGSSELAYRAADASGNVSTIKRRTVKVDAVAPLVFSTVDTNARTVMVTSTDHDPGSGVVAVECRVDGGEWVRTDGTAATATVGSSAAVVDYRATDAAGNVSWVGTTSVPPASDPNGQAKVRITSAGGPSPDGWFTQNVIVGLTPPVGNLVQYRIDGGRWKTARAPFTVGANGIHVIDHRLLKDGVVLDGSTGSTTVKLDKVVPTVGSSAVPENATGTPRNPVSLSFSGTDALSGIDHIEYRVNQGDWDRFDGSAPVLMSEVGNSLVAYRSVDEAGNVSSTRTVAVRIGEDPATSVTTSSRKVVREGFLTLSLVGFKRYDTVTVKVGEQEWGSVFTEANGAARITVQVPADAPSGDASLTASGSDGTPVASRNVTVSG